eukprot:CAMPEP_0172873014 /NCGR_PEP_ID=MMETSP1075-20121228/93882_1 /TAXON_ID=2916 /ORGANISM="Ceratium fusus, Strain PA161109" /LENGTH=182 /DNA_ID=CAMNT_0013723459 /DNA_START=150 /DNA_END=698 /DNA_ORIENTATION=-
MGLFSEYVFAATCGGTNWFWSLPICKTTVSWIAMTTTRNRAEVNAADWAIPGLEPTFSSSPFAFLALALAAASLASALSMSIPPYFFCIPSSESSGSSCFSLASALKLTSRRRRRTAKGAPAVRHELSMDTLPAPRANDANGCSALKRFINTTTPMATAALACIRAHDIFETVVGVTMRLRL